MAGSIDAHGRGTDFRRTTTHLYVGKPVYILLLMLALILAGCAGLAPVETLERSNSACDTGERPTILHQVAYEIGCMDPIRQQLSVLILVLALLIYVIIAGPLTKRVGQGGRRQGLTSIRVSLVVFTFALLMFTIGSQGENGGVVFLVATVAALFVLREPFADFMAGLTASIDRTYEVDDWIELNGHYGRVTKVGLRSIKLQTPDDSAVSIPHGQVRNATVVNANSAQPTHMCVANLYVQRDHDFRSARRILWDVAITSPYVLIDDDYPIAVIVVEQPYGLQYRVKAYPRFGADEFVFISDLTVRGREALRTIGIEMNHVLPIPE